MKLHGGCAVPGDDVAGQRLAARGRCQPDEGSTIVAEPARASALMVHGVVIVTARAGGVARGMTASSFSVLTPEPPIVAFAVRIGGSMHEILCRATGFAVSVLGDDQEFTARFFAGRRRPTDQEQSTRISSGSGQVSGAPLLRDALGWLDCRTLSRTPLDHHHLLVIGEALQDISAGRRAAGPLLHGNRRYHRRPEHTTPDRHDAGRG